MVSVKRGRDPRHYALMAFGGAGGLNACLVADALGIRTIVLPPSPGVTSAEGLLATDVRADRVITDVQREDALDIARLAGEFDDVYRQVREELERENFAAADIAISGFADMRYVGQAYEVRVPVTILDGHLSEAAIRNAIKAFHRAHDDRFGYEYEGRHPVEIVNLGATGFGLFPRLRLAPATRNGCTWDLARRDLRRGVFRGTGAVELPVYERDQAPLGVPLDGPAVIEQYDSMFVVDPGWRAMLDDNGQIIVSRQARED